MKQTAKYIVIVGLLLICLNAWAQDSITTKETSSAIIERIAEPYADELSDGGDQVTVLEDLENYAATPLNLNSATKQQLERLHFLTSYQIENLIEYRKKYGQIYTVFEIQAIDGFTAETANVLATFVSFIPIEQDTVMSIHQEAIFRYQQTLEKAEGFLPDEDGGTAYPGPVPHLYFRYKGNQNDRFRWGVTGENDPGEDLFSGSNKSGFDFYSAHVAYSGNDRLKTAMLGDYQVKFGQGLTVWDGYGQRKSVGNYGVRMVGQGIRPHTSADESVFMRGVAAELELGSFNLVAFYSHKWVDGNVVEYDDDSIPSIISSLQTTGYHRTSSEVEDEKSVRAQTLGSSIHFTQNRFSAGLNMVYQKLNTTLIPDDEPYARFYFSGKNNCNLSADALWVQNKMTMFGEAAISKSGGKAIVAGVESTPTTRVSLSLLYRNFAKDYQSIGGNAFSEWTEPTNEQGFYTGFNVLPFPRFKLSGYVDLYQSHWMRYTSLSPVRGNDTQFELDYNPTSKVAMYIRYKTETNSEKSSNESIIKQDVQQTTQRLRYNIEWQTNELMTLQIRTEISRYTKESDTNDGVMLSADAIFRLLSEKLTLAARGAWFNTDGYNARIYSYENDLPFTFYFPVYYGNGMRGYINIGWKISRAISANMKYGYTHYFDRDTIGNGNNAIDSSSKNEIKFQLRLRF